MRFTRLDSHLKLNLQLYWLQFCEVMVRPSPLYLGFETRLSDTGVQFLEDLLLSTILFFFAGKEMIVVQMTEIVHIVQSIYWVQMNALVYSLQCQLSVFRSPWE